MSESGSGMEIVHVEPTRPLEAQVSNNTNTAVAAVLAQMQESNRLARTLIAAITGDEQAKDVTPVTPTITPIVVTAPVVEAPKDAKQPTFTKGRLNDMKDAGLVPRGTTQKQALAGVDLNGKPLSAEALAVISSCKAPTGGMKQHFHDLKESGEPRPVKAEKPAATDELEAKVLRLVEGGFSPEEIKQILGIA